MKTIKIYLYLILSFMTQIVLANEVSLNVTTNIPVSGLIIEEVLGVGIPNNTSESITYDSEEKNNNTLSLFLNIKDTTKKIYILFKDYCDAISIEKESGGNWPEEIEYELTNASCSNENLPKKYDWPKNLPTTQPLPWIRSVPFKLGHIGDHQASRVAKSILWQLGIKNFCSGTCPAGQTCLPKEIILDKDGPLKSKMDKSMSYLLDKMGYRVVVLEKDILKQDLPLKGKIICKCMTTSGL